MTNSSATAAQISDAYIDESSQSQHRYLVLGGVILPSGDARTITNLILEARLPELPQGEMKWGKVSRAKLDAYKRVVDVFFDPRLHRTIEFHSLVVDTTKVDHARFNQGSREIGFNKEVYQLAMKFGRLYSSLFHIYPDRRTTTQRSEDLRLMLNRGIKKSGDKRDWPYRRVQFRESEEVPLLQLADIFAGAVAYHLNGHRNIAGASPAKISLSDYVLAKAHVSNVHRDTMMSGKFTIWHRRLR